MSNSATTDGPASNLKHAPLLSAVHADHGRQTQLAWLGGAVWPKPRGSAACAPLSFSIYLAFYLDFSAAWPSCLSGGGLGLPPVLFRSSPPLSGRPLMGFTKQSNPIARKRTRARSW
jgi:hypothetical protein